MDGDEFERWMTYAELAEARGISKASATRMAFRRKWRRQVGNDGVARVAVPAGQESPPEMAPRVTRQDGSMDGAMVFEAAIASLTAAREQAEKRADQAEVRADRERSRADAAESRADAAQEAARRARQDADELRQADEVRKARGRLTRAWRAWRGE